MKIEKYSIMGMSYVPQRHFLLNPDSFLETFSLKSVLFLEELTDLLRSTCNMLWKIFPVIVVFVKVRRHLTT